MQTRFLQHAQQQGLFRPGARIGVAVSGGADSVALLHLLHNARAELGIVLTVLHFDHGIRPDSASDGEFVAALAARLGLECASGAGAARAYAEATKSSLETAARELRLRFLAEARTAHRLDQVATAHTADDQAETVLMRLLRGTGSRGLAGIGTSTDAQGIIRPLLWARHEELVGYLRGRGEPWREDPTNLDPAHTRNRIRHELLPLLARDYNPEVVAALGRAASIAQEDEAYWQAEVARLLPLLLVSGKPARGGGRSHSANTESGIALETLLRQPLALRRRVLLAAAAKLGAQLDADHVSRMLAVAAGESTACELPGGGRVTRSLRELRITPYVPSTHADPGYDLPLPVPGQVQPPGVKFVVRARLEPWAAESAHDTLDANLLDVDLNALRVRSVRPGDRFRPAHSGGEKKVKAILQELRVPASERACWPVVTAAGNVVWVRGARPRTLRARQGTAAQRLVIEAED